LSSDEALSGSALLAWLLERGERAALRGGCPVDARPPAPDLLCWRGGRGASLPGIEARREAASKGAI